jgi:pimeloyl-ACP methyl ester carboxylesterase
LPFGHTFDDMIDVMTRALDVLGVQSAVMVGHSLGGRMVAEFAAANPERVIAAVLVNAAVGREFDEWERQSIVAPLAFVYTRLMACGIDLVADMRGSLKQRVAVLAKLAQSARSVPPGLISVGWASKNPRPSTVGPLAALRAHRVPTALVHGEHDLVIPFASAESAAEISGGTLHRVAGAHHSWLIVDPQRGAQVIEEAIDALIKGRDRDLAAV